MRRRMRKRTRRRMTRRMTKEVETMEMVFCCFFVLFCAFCFRKPRGEAADKNYGARAARRLVCAHELCRPGPIVQVSDDAYRCPDK